MMGDIIMVVGLAVSAFFAVRSLKNKKKKGGTCCGNCSRCSGCCHI